VPDAVVLISFVARKPLFTPIRAAPELGWPQRRWESSDGSYTSVCSLRDCSVCAILTFGLGKTAHFNSRGRQPSGVSGECREFGIEKIHNGMPRGRRGLAPRSFTPIRNTDAVASTINLGNQREVILPLRGSSRLSDPEGADAQKKSAPAPLCPKPPCNPREDLSATPWGTARHRGVSTAPGCRPTASPRQAGSQDRRSGFPWAHRDAGRADSWRRSRF
jgi:hypothetical protein